MPTSPAEDAQQPATLLESIAANIRRWRVKSGLTQEGLAERLGADLRYVQRLERGSLDIRMTTLAHLASALGATPSDLVRKARLPPAKRGRPRKSSS